MNEIVWYIQMMHGCKFGFEYLPGLGVKGTWVIEFICFRFVITNGVPDGPSDVQNSD